MVGYKKFTVNKQICRECFLEVKTVRVNVVKKSYHSSCLSWWSTLSFVSRCGHLWCKLQRFDYILSSSLGDVVDWLCINLKTGCFIVVSKTHFLQTANLANVVNLWSLLLFANWNKFQQMAFFTMAYKILFISRFHMYLVIKLLDWLLL